MANYLKKNTLFKNWQQKTETSKKALLYSGGRCLEIKTESVPATTP